MSGVTRTPLEQAQYDIRNLSSQLSSMHSRYDSAQRAANQARNEARNMERNLRGEMNRQNREYQRVVNNLQSDLAASERRHAQAINQLYDSFEQSMEEVGREMDAMEQRNVDARQKIKEKFDSKLKNTKKDFERKVNTLKEEMGERFDEQQKEYRELVREEARVRQELLRQQREEYIEITNRQRDEYIKITNQQRDEYLTITKNHQKQIDDINQEIDQIHQRDANRVEIAQNRLRDLNELINQVDRDLPHEWFAPGELADIREDLLQAQKDIDNDLAQAGAANIYQAKNKLIKLRSKVIIENRRFQEIHKEAIRKLNELLGIVQNNEVETAGEKRNINYWTEGAYGELEKKLEESKKRLEEGKENQNLTTQEVQDIYSDINKYEKDQNKLVQDTMERVTTSLQREQMAITIAKELGKKGYKIIDGNGFEQADPRKSYLVKVKGSNNPGATEIAVVIDPTFNNGANNEVIISSSDALNDDEARRQRSTEIVNVLRKKGINVGETKCEGSDHIHAFDGDGVKEIVKKGSSGIPASARGKVKRKI